MLVKNKNAVIQGASGALGGAIAAALAAAGAQGFLTRLYLAKVQKIVPGIIASESPDGSPRPGSCHY